MKPATASPDLSAQSVHDLAGYVRATTKRFVRQHRIEPGRWYIEVSDVSEEDEHEFFCSLETHLKHYCLWPLPDVQVEFRRHVPLWQRDDLMDSYIHGLYAELLTNAGVKVGELRDVSLVDEPAIAPDPTFYGWMTLPAFPSYGTWSGPSRTERKARLAAKVPPHHQLIAHKGKGKSARW